jgi:hypothetical protein
MEKFTTLTEGAQLAASWTRSPTVFKSDCKLIVNDITSAEASHSCWSSTLPDFISITPTKQNWKCIFAKHSQNYVVHEVAVSVRKNVVVDSNMEQWFYVN